MSPALNAAATCTTCTTCTILPTCLPHSLLQRTLEEDIQRGQRGKLRLAPELADEYNRIKQVRAWCGVWCQRGGV